MAGLDLFSVQQSIVAYLSDNLEWRVETGGVPEASMLPFVNGKMDPYVVLRFSEFMPASKGQNWGGAVNAEYYSYVDALCVGQTDTDARELSSVVNRILLGKKLPNASELRKIFGGGGFSVPDATRVPVAYISLASFAFNTNLDDVGSQSLTT